MKDIRLTLSDRIETLTDGVITSRAPRVITWTREFVHIPTHSEFVDSHGLLLAHGLARGDYRLVRNVEFRPV